MALLTDGPAVNAEGLARYETSLLDVMRIEQVPVNVKIELAQEACGQELADFVRRAGGHSAWDDEGLLRRVVVDARLRRWVAQRALSDIFSDAYSKQLNDRYARKQTEYRVAAADARESYFANGVGLVNRPLARPARPVLAAADGSGPGGTVYVAVTLADSVAESAPSDLSVITALPSSQVHVKVAGLNAWNLYTGTSPDVLHLQNADPLTAPETVIESLTSDGPVLPTGQRADVLIRWQRRLRRG